MIEDVYSRKIVGQEVYDHESGVLAAKLLERTLISENALQPVWYYTQTMGHG